MKTALAHAPVRREVVADLVLVRMALPGKAAPSAIRSHLEKLLGQPLPAAEFDEVRSELAAAGLLQQGRGKAYGLSDAGRERALRFLGVSDLPAGTKWPSLVAKMLFPKAAGLSASQVGSFTKGDQLAGLILKRKYGLGPGTGTTVGKVLEAVVCQHLGFPDETTLEGLLCAALSKLMNTERLSKNEVSRQLPCFETGLPDLKIETIRHKLVRDWLASLGTSGAPEARPEPWDLGAFAATVKRLAAESPPEARFAGTKVFIAPLWQLSQREPSFPRLTLAEFKQRLLEANSQGLLELCRADMVGAMDGRLVAESETTFLNATFHFVLIGETR